MNVHICYKEVGSRLTHYRKRSGLTQWEVAEALDYKSSQFISNIERGLCPIPAQLLKTLFDTYNVRNREKDEIVRILTREFRTALSSQVSA